MNVGGDFFKILNFAIAIMRLWGQIFGTDEDRKAVKESEDRTANQNAADVC